MTAPIETEVLIVGGGLYGCATAYFLAQYGVETLVVDAGDIGAEASGANSGNLHLQLAPSTHASKSMEWLQEFAATLPVFLSGHELWRALARELPRDIEMRFPGGIMVAEDARQLDILRDKVTLERANGLDSELLDKKALHALAPYIADDVAGAAFCRGEGMANTLLAVIALWEGAAAKGAGFLPHCTVDRLENAHRRWIAHTDRGTIRSRHVVIAAGYRSDALARTVDVPLSLTHRPIHVSATEPCAPFIEHLLYHTELRLTMKQAANGNVIIGGGWSGTVDPVYGRPAVLHDSLRRSLWVAQRVVPQTADLHVLRAWSGRNVYTPDGKPILGPVPGRPGLHLAVCNTYGFTMGPLCGLFVAQQLAGRRSSYDLAGFSIARF
jgi:glycine/D-amino acid oxidase-like deaminating enzyme